MSENNKFGTKLGVIAATVGSAIGMGTVWRFPAEAQTNGGAAFLIIYVLCVFILGIPVMLAEFSLGRAGGSDSVGNFKNLTPHNHWWIAGAIGLVASYMIIAFYMVVAGWTIEYMFDSFTGNLYAGYVPTDHATSSTFFSEKMGEYVGSTCNPIIWTSIMIVLNIAILVMGVAKGIEKISNVLMPLLFVLMLMFCYVSLSLPGAGAGVEFFLKPDFSKITVDVVINALGQAFFSLSLGMGILVTYAAYYPADTKLTKTSITVSMLAFMMSLLMGLIIFPAVKSFGIAHTNAELEGTSLVFVTLPEIFANIAGTRFWSSLFFLLLAVAAITSTISIAEVSVAFVRDRFKMSRTKSVLLVCSPVFVLSALCSLSLGSVPGIRLCGLSLFDFLDTVATNILLPISALAICIYTGWVLPRRFLADQLTNHGTISSRTAPVFIFLIRWIAPVLLVGVFVAKLVWN